MSSELTRVFISYSHDSPAHMDQVLRLSDRLRADGVDCQIDQYEVSPSEGWQTWCMNRVKGSEFVITICTETYERRFSGEEQPGRGRGVTFEGYIITQVLYDEQCKNDKFIPTIFSISDSGHIPTILKGSSIYDLSGPQGYELLYRRLTNQPLVIKPELGQVKTMPSRSIAPLPKLQRKQEFLAPLWNVPLPRNPFFTGRESILEELTRKFSSSKRVALNGMRGVGKTQTAAHYAHLHRREYQDVLWARAEARETLVGDFVAIAGLLQLPQKDEKDQSAITAAVKNWLETNSGWLLILDNADHLALVRDFVPLIHSGYLLLTTTALALGGLAERIPVDEMREDEAALFLLRRATLLSKDSFLDAASPTDQELARDLARELGGLPLALDQAGAYIEETPSTLAEYKQLYEKKGKQFRQQRGELSTDHPSVTVTFSLAFNELAKRDAVAADLVRLCAFLAPDAIPEEIFTVGAPAIGKEFAERMQNSDFNETVKQATKLSLMRRDARDRSLDIHRIVQQVLKDEMDATQLRQWAERAVHAVNSAFPNVEFRYWQECERLLPNARACAAWIERFSFEFKEAPRLLNQTGLYLFERAQYADAERMFESSLAIREKSLGLDHPDSAPCLNNLAALYRDQRRYAEAEALHQRALAIWEKALGPENSSVATSLNNLALLYIDQRRNAEAEPLLKRALAIDEKVLGESDPSLAIDLHNLGNVYRELGRYAEAEPLLRRALSISEGTLGPEDPQVAFCANSLGVLFANQGEYAEAERYYQQSLAIREKALGPDHPQVATLLENYAVLLRDTERKTEALPLEARANAIREKMKKQVKA